MPHPLAVSPEVRAVVMERDGGKCRACKSTVRLAIDHVLSPLRGGGASLENLQVLCHRCNCGKGGATMEEWMEGLRRRREKFKEVIEYIDRILG